MRKVFRERLMAHHQGEKEKTESLDGYEKIEAMQIQKKEVMRQLKERLRYVEADKEFTPETPHVWKVRKEGETFTATDEAGTTTILTKGDILTDFTWGVGYKLDPESVPYLLRKEYALALAKHKLLQLTDQQIIESERSGTDGDGNTFDIIGERMEQENWDLGHLAERFVVNYLKKVVINAELPFEIIEVDVFEDVEDKIDFIIRKKGHARGVEVEATDDEGSSIAVQLTLKDRKDQVLKKKAIMESTLFDRGLKGDVHISDAALLYISEKWVRRALGKWKHRRLSEDSSSPAPGGPERLMDEEGQREVLYRIFDRLLSEEEIDEVCRTLGIYSKKRVRDWTKTKPSKELEEQLEQIRRTR